MIFRKVAVNIWHSPSLRGLSPSCAGCETISFDIMSCYCLRKHFSNLCPHISEKKVCCHSHYWAVYYRAIPFVVQGSEPWKTSGTLSSSLRFPCTTLSQATIPNLSCFGARSLETIRCNLPTVKMTPQFSRIVLVIRSQTKESWWFFFVCFSEITCRFSPQAAGQVKTM